VLSLVVAASGFEGKLPVLSAVVAAVIVVGAKLRRLELAMLLI
jgi:hypothetical protein